MPERADRMTSRRKTQTMQRPNNIKGLAVNITFETCIWSVDGPNFIRHIKYIDYFSLLYSIVPETFKDSTSISSLQNSSKS